MTPARALSSLCVVFGSFAFLCLVIAVVLLAVGRSDAAVLLLVVGIVCLLVAV